MYLSLVTDAYSKKIMGYDLSDSLDTQGSLNALNMANRNRLYRKATLIHHDDRSIQYCSDAYQKLLKRYHIIPSMTILRPIRECRGRTDKWNFQARISA